MTYFYLENSVTSQRVKLSDGALTIGRNGANQLVIDGDEKGVSSYHAILYVSQSGMMLQDMNSKNGTFVNEEPVKEKKLSVGDVIGLGKKGPRFRLIRSESELAQKKSITASDEIKSDVAPPTTSTLTATRKPKTKVSPFPQSDSLTAQYERKILDNQLADGDLDKVLKNSRRLQKIMDRGNISEENVTILAGAHEMHHRLKKRNIMIFSVVFIVILFLFIGLLLKGYFNHQTEARVALLEDKLNSYDRQIFALNSKGDSAKPQLEELVREFKRAQEQLSKLGGARIDNEDSVKLFIDDIMVRFGETNYHIPPQMLKSINGHINIYSGRMHKTIAKYLGRRDKYFKLYRNVFKEKKLPIELAYVSMLESGLNPKALSHVGARGLWQFMPRTARSYGLKVNGTVDERIDPEKSTRAAAEYFSDLISIFGGKSSIMLAMAAYNAGEGRVMGALKKIDDPVNDRNFWYIYRMGYLAEETNEYIPRILSLMIIDEHRESYGFEEN